MSGATSSHDNQKTLIGVFALGSGMVRAGLAREDSIGAPHFLTTRYAPIAHAERLDADILEHSMLRALKEVARALERDARELGAPERFIFVIGSPWYLGACATLRHEQQKSFLVDRDRIEAMLRDAEHEPTMANLAGLSRVEDALLEVKVNGYATGNPLGKRGRALEITLYRSALAAPTRQRIEEAIEAFFHLGRKTTFVSQGLALFTGSRDILGAAASDFILLDVGAEVTDVFLVDDDVLRGLASFPYGSRTLVRDIATTLSVPAGEAESRIGLARKDAKGDDALARAILVGRARWREGLDAALRELAPSDMLPSVGFVHSEDATGAWFAKALEAPAFEKRTRSGDRIEALLLTPSMLSSAAHFDGAVRHDALLALAAAFGNQRDVV